MRAGTFQEAMSALLAAVVALAPLARPAAAADAIARISKITAPSANPKEAREVPYPTSLVQLVTGKGQTDVSKDTSIQAGAAVLTRSANTHVKLEQGLETMLYSNTFVRFDGLNVWLLRQGRAYVVSKRGKLEIVAEALGRILISSKVYLRAEGSQLLAYVTEGNVVLEANARTLALRPGEAGRIPAGQGPQPASLTPDELAEIRREIQAAERVMKGGGGGGVAIAALLAAGAAGAVIATRGGDLPDLVPDGTGAACTFDRNANAMITIRNVGKADAPPSITHIEFEAPLVNRRAAGPAALDLQTPPIPAGGLAPVTISPNFLQSLRMRVAVDSAGAVEEANEDNNTGLVACPIG